MDADITLKFIIIFCASVLDVTFATLRSMSIVQGRPFMAWIFAFAEKLIWLWVVVAVIQNLEHPALIFAYAAGTATGSSLGMGVEKLMAYGERMIFIFSRFGEKLAKGLREEGYIVSMFQGEGRDGPVQLLFTETRRINSMQAVNTAREIDPDSVCLLNTANVRSLKAR